MPFHLVMNMFHHCRSERKTSVESGIGGKPFYLSSSCIHMGYKGAA